MMQGRRAGVRARVFLCGVVFGLAVFSLPLSGMAQHPGGLDNEYHVGAGASDDVFAAANLPNGETLLGGYFTSFNGQERWRLARLRADGTLDPGFDPGESSGSAPITAVAALPDGNVLVAGSFARFGGMPHPLIVRLKPDGTVDPGFNAAPAFAGVEGRVLAVVPLPGGSMLVGGRFDPSAGSPHGGTSLFLVRLLTGGQRDHGFACAPTPTSREDQLTALAMLPDGKLLMGTQAGVARLDANGAQDGGFHPTPELAGTVTALLVQTDGRTVVAMAGAMGGWKIGRLEADGKPDATFHLVEATGDGAGSVLALTCQPDGKILVGGTFREIGGVHHRGVARLNGDGSLDRSFDPGTGIEVLPFDDADETPDAAVHVLLPLPDGKLLVAGRFDLYNGAPCHNVGRVFNGTTPAVPSSTPATAATPTAKE